MIDTQIEDMTVSLNCTGASFCEIPEAIDVTLAITKYTKM